MKILMIEKKLYRLYYNIIIKVKKNKKKLEPDKSFKKVRKYFFFWIPQDLRFVMFLNKIDI